MKVIRVFGNIIFMAAAIFFCLCMSIRPLCASTVSGAVLGRAVSSRVLDEVYKVYPEVTSEQMEEVENFLEEKPGRERTGGRLSGCDGRFRKGRDSGFSGRLRSADRGIETGCFSSADG